MPGQPVTTHAVADAMELPQRQQGMTILELLITLAILGIVTYLAVPSFVDTLGRMASNSAARSLAATLQLARSEAVKAGSDVSICPSSNGTDCTAGAWNSGWIVFIDANGDADGAAGSVDAGDRVIRAFEPFSDLTLTVAPATNLLQYDNRGFGKNATLLTFTVCPADGNADNTRGIEVSLSGRARFLEEGLSC